MVTKVCLSCLIEKSLTSFPAQKKRDGTLYHRPHCFSCKYSKEILLGRVINKEYHREYYYSNKLDLKYKAYCHNDKVKFNGSKTIEKELAISLMMQPCYYCNKENSNGLDRKENNKGHTETNVVSCCEKCNYILGDIPFEAKKELSKGFVEINKKGLLDKWTIPTKRTVTRT